MNRKNQTITKVTALYCRLSIEDGRDNESMSISNQKLMLKDYADKHGLYPCEYYVDDGYTGRNSNRPDFQRMLSDIEKGKIGTVITKDDCVIIGLNRKSLINSRVSRCGPIILTRERVA